MLVGEFEFECDALCVFMVNAVYIFKNVSVWVSSSVCYLNLKYRKLSLFRHMDNALAVFFFPIL